MASKKRKRYYRSGTQLLKKQPTPDGGDTASTTMGAASTGASVGGTVGSVIPGVGTAIGAAAGAVVGGTAGFVVAKNQKADAERVNRQIGNTNDYLKSNVGQRDPNVYIPQAKEGMKAKKQKPNPKEEDLVEVEGGELLIDMINKNRPTMIKVEGPSHKKGGVKANVNPGTMIVSKDKAKEVEKLFGDAGILKRGKELEFKRLTGNLPPDIQSGIRKYKEGIKYYAGGTGQEGPGKWLKSLFSKSKDHNFQGNPPVPTTLQGDNLMGLPILNKRGDSGNRLRSYTQPFNASNTKDSPEMSLPTTLEGDNLMGLPLLNKRGDSSNTLRSYTQSPNALNTKDLPEMSSRGITQDSVEMPKDYEPPILERNMQVNESGKAGPGKAGSGKADSSSPGNNKLTSKAGSGKAGSAKAASSAPETKKSISDNREDKAARTINRLLSSANQTVNLIQGLSGPEKAVRRRVNLETERLTPDLFLQQENLVRRRAAVDSYNAAQTAGSSAQVSSRQRMVGANRRRQLNEIANQYTNAAIQQLNRNVGIRNQEEMTNTQMQMQYDQFDAQNRASARDFLRAATQEGSMRTDVRRREDSMRSRDERLMDVQRQRMSYLNSLSKDFYINEDNKIVYKGDPGSPISGMFSEEQ